MFFSADQSGQKPIETLFQKSQSDRCKQPSGEEHCGGRIDGRQSSAQSKQGLRGVGAIYRAIKTASSEIENVKGITEICMEGYIYSEDNMFLTFFQPDSARAKRARVSLSS